VGQLRSRPLSAAPAPPRPVAAGPWPPLPLLAAAEDSGKEIRRNLPPLPWGSHAELRAPPRCHGDPTELGQRATEQSSSRLPAPAAAAGVRDVVARFLHPPAPPAMAVILLSPFPLAASQRPPAANGSSAFLLRGVMLQ
jgi:hypothetical protein